MKNFDVPISDDRARNVVIVHIGQPRLIFSHFCFDFWYKVQNVVFNFLVASDELCMGLGGLCRVNEIRLQSLDRITQNDHYFHSKKYTEALISGLEQKIVTMTEIGLHAKVK